MCLPRSVEKFSLFRFFVYTHPAQLTMSGELREKILDLRAQIEAAREKIENIRRGREDTVNEMRMINEEKWRLEYQVTRTEMALTDRMGPNRRARLEAKLASLQQEVQDCEDRVSWRGNECRNFWDPNAEEAKAHLAQLEVELREARDRFDYYRYCKLTHQEELLDDPPF